MTRGTLHICLAMAVAAIQPADAAVALAANPARLEPVRLAYERFTLPNGLTVLVYTDHSVPTIYVGVRYRTGSRDEPPGKSGFAHLFEHLMFQPTAHRAGEFFAPLERAGATDMNGTTDFDYTGYFETIPSNALDLALWLESDRMGFLDGGITQGLLDEQRSVVKNEMRQGNLQPDANLAARFQAGFYPAGHPYAHTTIGSTEDLDRASLADVKGWFRDRYGASNAVLVLAGDVDAVNAHEKVARYFGAIHAGAPASRSLQWVPEFGQIRREVVYGHFPTTTVARTWPIANDDPRATTLMLLLARTLAGAKDTPLERALIEQDHVATDVSAQFTENALASTFAISMTLAPGVSFETANQALDAAIARYFTAGPDPKRLRTVVDATDGAILTTLESNARIGDFLASGETEHGDPVYFLKQRRWVGAARPAEIAALAARWLSRPYYEMRMLPTPPTPPAVPDVDRAHVPEPGTFDGHIDFPTTTTMRLPNGLKLVVAERHRAPTVDLSLVFAAGSLTDRYYRPGTAAGAFTLMAAGSREHDRASLALQVSRLGAALAIRPGERETALTWTATAGDLDRTVALVADVVRRPLYPETALAARAAVPADPRDATAAGSTIFARAVWGELAGGDGTVSEADHGVTNREAIVRFHDREIGPDNATLYMVGDVTPAEARRIADARFGDWRPGSPTLSPVTGSPAPHARVILVDAPGAQQSSITVGMLTQPFDADRSATDSIVDAALGGAFASRLNADLRGRGWSYNFTGGIEDRPAGPRLFSASGSVQTDETAASMAAIRSQIAEYVSTRPITADEMEAVRSASIHAVPLGFTDNGSFLASMATSASYGLPYDRAATATRRLAAVTLDDARQTARELYRPDALTWVVVGDLRLIEASVRALHLGPVEVRDVSGRELR